MSQKLIVINFYFRKLKLIIRFSSEIKLYLLIQFSQIDLVLKSLKESIKKKEK